MFVYTQKILINVMNMYIKAKKKKINVTRLYVDIKLMCLLFKLNIPKVELRKLKIFKKKTHRYYEFCLLFIINIFILG